MGEAGGGGVPPQGELRKHPGAAGFFPFQGSPRLSSLQSCQDPGEGQDRAKTQRAGLEVAQEVLSGESQDVTPGRALQGIPQAPPFTGEEAP